MSSDDGHVLGPLPEHLWELPEMRRALACRDIGTVFRLLTEAEVSQREIARHTGQTQSEISEILAGRHVLSVWVLERIADGFGVPRGWMGLLSTLTVEAEPESVEEVDDDVERRNFLAIAGAVLFGEPVFGDPRPLTLRDVVLDPPSRVGANDVVRFTDTVTRLGVLDRESGGMAVREALAATARNGERMLSARMTDPVRQRMRTVVSEAHRLAGWASGDIGLKDHCRWHMHQALDYAEGSPGQVSQVLCSAGSMEKHDGDQSDALKMFQLAQIGTDRLGDQQARAVAYGLSASAYLKLGHPRQAQSALAQARSLFAEADHDSTLSFWAFYGPGHGLLAAAETKLGNLDRARADVTNALNSRPDFDIRCNALDTIVLATTMIRAGDRSGGVRTTRHALDLVARVGSQRVRDRLRPLAEALTERRDSTCQDLAVRVRSAIAQPAEA